MQNQCKVYHTFGAEVLLTVLTAVVTSTTYLRNLVITLVAKVLQDIGSLPKTSSPQPGDLIYFQNTYKSWPFSHGYLPWGGSFIQAGDNGVAIDSLSKSYWKSHFLGYTKAP